MARAKAKRAARRNAPPTKAKGKPRGKPFQPGQSGNPAGRPMHSRQRLSEKFIDALGQDFDEHGVSAIQRMRRFKPDAYVRVVADLLPKNVKLEADPSQAFVALWKKVSEVR